MCQLFIDADALLWVSRLRSVRLHGFSTSLRLENIYWRLLEEIAGRDGLSLNEILRGFTRNCSKSRARSRISPLSCASAAPAI